MTGQVDLGAPGHSIRLWALHSLLLFAAMVAPFLYFLPTAASLWSAATGAVYLLWWMVAGALRDRGVPLPPAKILWLFMGYISAVPLIALGLMMAASAAWVAWAYKPSILADVPGAVSLVLALLILLPLLFLMFAPALAREDGGDASRFLRGIRGEGPGHFQRSWLGGTAIMLGLICLLNFVATAVAMDGLQSSRTGGNAVTALELVAAFPFLPLTLIVAVVMLAVARVSVSGRRQVVALVRAYTDGISDIPAVTRRAKTASIALAAGGWAATLFVTMYPVHLGMVAALGGVAGIMPLTVGRDAVEAWVAGQREAGRPVMEIAADLNRIGIWPPDGSSDGLVIFVENGEDMSVDGCSVRTAAGVTDPTSHAAYDWLPAEQAASDLKYCLAVSCASPVTWDAPPALLLASSHDSQATFWMRYLYIDVFADGAAAAPGGYCTETGELADEYQG